MCQQGRLRFERKVKIVKKSHKYVSRMDYNAHLHFDLLMHQVFQSSFLVTDCGQRTRMITRIRSRAEGSDKNSRIVTASWVISALALGPTNHVYLATTCSYLDLK